MQNSGIAGTEPCGTPKVAARELEVQPEKDAICERPERYERKHDKATPEAATYSNLHIKISWSAVSKAADRARWTTAVNFPLSFSLKILLAAPKRALSVEWWHVVPDWHWADSECFSTFYKRNLLCRERIFTSTFERTERRNTGWYLATVSGSRPDIF